MCLQKLGTSKYPMGGVLVGSLGFFPMGAARLTGFFSNCGGGDSLCFFNNWGGVIGFFLAVFFSWVKLSFAVLFSNLPVFLFAVFFQILKSTRFFNANIKSFKIIKEFYQYCYFVALF